MAQEARGESERTGEPTPPLTVTPNQATPGDTVHIVLVGPPGGTASVEFTLLPPRETTR